MQPQTEVPLPGQVTEIAPNLRRILAPNPGPMTFHGTNTYLVGHRGLAVIDPGPASDAHLAAILSAVQPGQRITHILVTHAHLDHAPLARPLSRATGAPVLAFGDARAGRSAAMAALADSGDKTGADFGTDSGIGGGEGVDEAFAPDHCLADGATVAGDGWTLRAHWTPGHMGNHMAFALADAVFTGDLVMGWSSSLISPPDGDMGDYMASCARVDALGASVFHPGHGPAVHDPRARIAELLAHRRDREASLIAALDKGPADLAPLTAQVYGPVAAPVMAAARRNALAHLVDLAARGLVAAEPRMSQTARFTLRQRPPGKDDKKTTNASGRS